MEQLRSQRQRIEPIVTGSIRNVAVVGHAGVGTTTLAEAALFRAGVTTRIGTVPDGTTVLDREPEAIDRGASVSLGVASFDWTASDGHHYRVNLIDTPGHPDFAAEVDAALAVADLAVVVVSATDGVQPATEQAWRRCAERALPRLVFVTREDQPRADFDRVVADLTDHFGSGITPIELPLGEEATFHGVVDVLSETAHEYDPDGYHHEVPVPTEIAERERALHDLVVEEIVSGDDAELERYLDGEVPTVADLERTLRSEVLAGIEFPVLVGSGMTGVGVDRLLDYACELGPAPSDRPVTVLAGDRAVEVTADPQQRPLLQVFKNVSDQYVGKVSLFKVVTGTLEPDTVLRDVQTGTDERLHALFHVCGAEQTPASRLVAGDIGAVSKLSGGATGSTLAPPDQPVAVAAPPVPTAHLATALVPRTQADDDKLPDALHRIAQEDPALQIGHDAISRRTVVRTVGDAHLAVTLARLARKFGVSVDTEPVRIGYRRTIAATAEVDGRIKKQSGGHGQFAQVTLRVSPQPRGGGFEFVDATVGGAIPKQYVAAVRHGIEEAMAGGAGRYPVVDVRVECIDGKTHSVDSSDMAFKLAGALGFQEAIEQAGEVLLEPVARVVARVPVAAQGDVLGDLSARRGKVVASETDGDGTQVITAHVPHAEIGRYAMDLRAMTGGRGEYDVATDHYDVLPDHLVAGALAQGAS